MAVGSGVHAAEPGASVSAVRDVFAQWFMYLIVLAGFGATILSAFWVGRGRRDDVPAPDIDTHVETVVIPLQRERSR